MVRSTNLRPRHRRSGGFLSAAFSIALALGLAAGPGTAQQPTRPDTTRRVPADTTRRPAPDTTRRTLPDTGALARDSGRVARDTTPPPQLPVLPRPVAAGFSTGVWVFDREAIERLGTAVTLAKLLETVPGIVRLHSGYYVQPEAVSALGQTAGRVQVYLDGFELAPLDGSVIDLSRIELAEIGNVRVERGLGALRVELTSLSPATAQPYAYIQALIAQPNSKLFRGVFLGPRFLFGPVAFGVERLDTDGTHRREPGDEFSAWGKWSKIWRNKGGFQAEYRTNTVHRNAIGAPTDVPWVGTFANSDWTIRGRWQFFPGVVAEAYFGATSLKDRHLVALTDTSMATPLVAGPVTPLPGPLDSTNLPADAAARDSALQRRTQIRDSLIALHNKTAAQAADTLLDLSDHQAGARLGLQRGPFWADAALRTHSAAFLPKNEGDATAGVVWPRIGDADATIHTEKRATRQLTETRLRGRLGPFRGLSAFAEATSGERGIGAFTSDTTVRVDSLFTKRSGWRAGVDLDRSWISAGIARVSVSTDSLPGFGLPFDPLTRYVPSGSMQGWESHGRVRLFWKPLSAEYWYMAWTQFKFAAPDTGGTIAGSPVAHQPLYVPDQQWRASLVYHQSPLKTGHLDLYARLDAHSRGVMYDAVDPTTAAPVPAITSIDFYLQIRIMDLRIYFEERGITQKPTEHVTDFPLVYGRDVPAPRIVYGVRWQFFD